MNDSVESYLDTLPEIEDHDIDLGLAALSISARSHPKRSMDRYINHIEQIRQKTGERFKELLDAGAEDSAGTRLAALKHVVHDEYGYDGNRENYENIDNADLVEVIEKRKGLPVALAILYMCAAEAQGWDVQGLNFPSHFLLRIEHGGERLIFDPFNACRVMEAPELRQLIKSLAGEGAELSASFYETISKRDILIRLQNNVKLRLIEYGDYHMALETIEMMRKIDPGEFRLLLDAGVLYARTGKPKTAIPLLEDYIDKAPDVRDREEAALIVRKLKETLN